MGRSLQGRDKPGFATIYDINSNNLGTISLEMLSQTREIEWSNKGAQIKGRAGWNFENGSIWYWNYDTGKIEERH